MLTIEGCRARQLRFRERLLAARLDAAVVSDVRDIYYLTGLLPSEFPALLYLETEGSSWLVAHTDEGDVAVDDRSAYEYHKLYTMNPDPLQCLVAVLRSRVGTHRHVERLGFQEENLPRLVAGVFEDGVTPSAWVQIDTTLTDLQQCKDSDEIALLKKSVQCTLAGYRAAAAMIRPGVNELDVLEAAHRAATLTAGETVRYTGDFRCGEFGGPARNRSIEAGELYIIDAGTAYRGYYSDMARTYAVTEPTDLQTSVYSHIAAILRDVPSQVQLGGSGTDLWRWIDSRLREHPHLADRGLIHHGGHGVGTRIHEPPDLNRDRGGTFAVGNVFSCEPGAYSPELRAGIRLENTFVISESGVENISRHPLNLRAAVS